jgi:putative peptidoglycan lipid II flippase
LHPFSSNYLFRNAKNITICRVLATASGLLLDTVVLATFGLGVETDSFFAALAIPQLVTAVLEVQAPNVLVPVLTALNTGTAEGAWRLLGTLSTAAVLVSSLLSLVATAVAAPFFPLLVPGLTANGVALAAKLFAVLIWLLPFRSLEIILGSALYTYHHYVFPSLSKLMTNGAAVIVVLLLRRRIGIYALALGFLVGSIIPVVLYLRSLRAEGFRWHPALNTRDEQFRKTLKLFLYPLGGHGLSACRELLENFLASFLMPGSLSAFRYASRIVQSLAGILVGGILTPSLPLISHYGARNELEEMKASLVKSIKLILLVSVPMCVWLVFLGEPALELLFERGRFTSADAALTASLVALMAPYILFSRIVAVTQIPFFAVMDTRTPAVSSLVSFVAHAAILIPLNRLMGIYAFPIAMSTFSICTSWYLFVGMRRRFSHNLLRDLRPLLLKLIVVSLFTGLALRAGKGFFTLFAGGGLYGRLAALLMSNALGGLTLLVSLLLVGVVSYDQIRALRPKQSPAAE